METLARNGLMCWKLCWIDSTVENGNIRITLTH